MCFRTRVESLGREADAWVLKDGDGGDLGRFDLVVVSAPAPQTGALLQPWSPVLAATAASVEMAPCWAVMVTFPDPLNLDFDGAFVNDSAISWVARNSSKPDRPGCDSWVIHASTEWSTANLEMEPDPAAESLFREFADLFGTRSERPEHLTAHRWRYALPQDPLAEPFLFDQALGLAACGDWCGGPRVEGAFLSGLTTAEALIRHQR